MRETVHFRDDLRKEHKWQRAGTTQNIFIGTHSLEQHIYLKESILKTQHRE